MSDENDILGLDLGNDEAADVLGLDQEIKLVKRVKTARLDNERVFHPQTGLNYILKHHISLSNTIKKNDKKFAKRYGSSAPTRAAKYDHEFENLSTILQFYQLWCHGLFPKANFRDCIQLLRKLGAKSPQLRLYRRELIEKELEKLKIAKGIIIENDETDTYNQNDVIVNDNDDDSNRNDNENIAAPEPGETEETPVIDDDWGFMNVPKRSNGLFVGLDDDEDDDLYTTPSIPIQRPQLQSVDRTTEIEPPQLQQMSDETTEIEAPDLQSVNEDTNNVSDDPFSDDDDINNILEEEPPNEEDIMEDDQDLDLMREMGME